MDTHIHKANSQNDHHLLTPHASKITWQRQKKKKSFTIELRSSVQDTRFNFELIYANCTKKLLKKKKILGCSLDLKQIFYDSSSGTFLMDDQHVYKCVNTCKGAVKGE